MKVKFERRFELLYGQQPFEVPGTQDDRCEFAKRYAEWIAPILREVEQARTIVAVNQALLLVTRQYLAWRVVVPKSHRNRIGDNGHPCIFHCFEETALKLKSLELSIQPPLVTMPVQPSVPPPPPPPAPLAIAGIFFGENE